MKLFVDTSAFLALLNRSDRYHAAAAGIWKELLSNSLPDLFTTNYVLLETTALIQRRLGIEALRAFSTRVHPILHIVWIDRDLHGQGLSTLLSQGHRRLSLVDCLSFEVMRRFNIDKAFAFDRDFSKQGFQLLES